MCKSMVSNLTNMGNFQPRYVVGRGSETQHNVVENVNKFTLQDKD